MSVKGLRGRRLPLRLAWLYVGLTAFGVSLGLLVRARLGLDPWDVLSQGIARRTGIPIGWVVDLIGAVVLLAWIPLRQRPGLGTVSNVVLVGIVLNAALRIIPAPAALLPRLAMLASAIALNALATACYLGARLGPGPRDGLMTGIVARGHALRTVRTAIELTVLLAGVALGGSAGIGTLAYALAIGPLVHLLLPRLTLHSGTAAAEPETTIHTELRCRPMQPLLFGLSLSTSAAPDADPVGQAQAAEAFGFDFVSASDHPSGPHPTYETWTMLTWIAAATSRIAIASRVLSVPFRPPALVAKMAESLDRLAGGRLILGLGAGAADPELRAFGLPVPSARDKVDGLADALQVIRGLWRQPAFSYAGRVYATDAADLEPKPQRAIPIWLGTFGARALAVTGRYADGWIPTLGYVPEARLAGMRGQVLAAAKAAGRAPEDVTCALHLQVSVGHPDPDPDILSGSPRQIAGRLGELAEIGFTAFNFSTAGPRPAAEQVERLASEVLPVLRGRP